MQNISVIFLRGFYMNNKNKKGTKTTIGAFEALAEHDSKRKRKGSNTTVPTEDGVERMRDFSKENKK